MAEALPFSKADFLFTNEWEEQNKIGLLDRLSMHKISWEECLAKVGDPCSIAKGASKRRGYSLLHLAVLDHRLDVIEILKKDPLLKFRRDAFGLSPIELAQFLDRKEALRHLDFSLEAPQVATFPALSPFEYLSHPVFESPEALERVLSAVLKAKEEDKIPAEKIWMGIYFDKELQKGTHPPVAIRYISEEIGYGVFSEKKIAPCTYVGEYTGVVKERTAKELKDKRHCLRYTIWEGKKNFTIDAEEKGNFTRFINHSSKPNLGLQSIYWRGIPRMIFVALKEIKEGAQLTFDYGPLFWQHMRQAPKELSDDY